MELLKNCRFQSDKLKMKLYSQMFKISTVNANKKYRVELNN